MLTNHLKIGFNLILVLILISFLAIGCSSGGGGGDDNDDNPDTPQADNSVTLLVGSDNADEIEHPDGAKLLISEGTVGLTSGGQPGEILFSIEPSTVTATVPTGFTSEGQPWEFGPEGITLGRRARMGLPIPDDTTKGYILARLNQTTNTWEVVPSLRIAEDSGRIYADVKHFSIWSVFSYGPIDPEAAGIVHFSNTDPTRWLSVCVRSYTLTFPDRYPNFDPSGVGTALSAAGHIPGVTSSADAIVPQGTWEFEVMRTETVSAFSTAEPDGWIVYPELVVVDTPGNGPSINLNPSSWTNPNMDPLWAPCEGAPSAVFGTGNVQVTLTWDDPVDLDLHVFEPSGEEIYFGNKTSATGGQLDVDTICESTTQGRPENIFWTTQEPLGTYVVKVHLYSLCSTTLESVTFRVRTVVAGASRTFTGSVSGNQTVTVTTFTR